MAPSGGGMNPVIEVASLRKAFKGRDGASRAVLTDLNLTVGAGEFLCILGPSGCGKSTLLNVLAGLDRAYEGRVSVNGGRVEYNTYDVDGGDILNASINGSHSTLIVYPSLDAIGELQVLTSNFGAMYGRSASGTILAVTKTGGPVFHGDGYFFLRQLYHQ